MTGNVYEGKGGIQIEEKKSFLTKYKFFFESIKN